DTTVSTPEKRIWGDKICLVQGDILTLKVDAIVNAANSILKIGSGLNAAVGKAMTIIIHTVPPKKKKDSDPEDPASLRRCYEKVMDVVSEKRLKSVAFCCLGTENHKYPREAAASVAIQTIKRWLEEHKDAASQIERIIFCVYKDEDLQIYRRTIPVYFPVKRNYRPLVNTVALADRIHRHITQFMKTAPGGRKSSSAEKQVTSTKKRSEGPSSSSGRAGKDQDSQDKRSRSDSGSLSDSSSSGEETPPPARESAGKRVDKRKSKSSGSQAHSNKRMRWAVASMSLQGLGQAQSAGVGTSSAQVETTTTKATAAQGQKTSDPRRKRSKPGPSGTKRKAKR
ncbi:O-acetyl-ADP-ribose deacetylase macrod1, partial [Gryganskiella cystojenkinii]